ncbi:MAG: DMT family transporter [Ignavibacteriales bacterium]|jgi:drug/metabolite transporter (DMT)-like permease|uniref:EamA family transporter n=1 Tax=Stygiobacter electus TaxID=3032292 RepID=A0AAE3P0M4_9BACT|nr:EamA family transporter [Stygiobacter electus]MBI5807707.1 DMT family transporter [Ignavibacteriales bacterium]MDF1610645.1 EamA family transporter [Stygiobacter electus]
MKLRPWLIYAIITTIFWGIWGSLIEIPEKAGFPATLGYIVWAFTMIPPMFVALKIINWKLEYDKKSIFLGSLIGLTGAGGQLILFIALKTGPAYLVFPIISLSPVITVLLSYVFLKERANLRIWIGIILALISIPLLSYQSSVDSNSTHGIWIVFALLVFFAWGFQAYTMRFANQTMKAESIFFYMTITAILLSPLALLLTDFSKPINFGFNGPILTALIQTLNSVGALMLVYAFRYGKAIIVSPLTNAVAPIITVIISLSIYKVIPHIIIIIGMTLALIAVFLMALENE